MSVHSLSDWNLEVLIFVEGGKAENSEKKSLEQEKKKKKEKETTPPTILKLKSYSDFYLKIFNYNEFVNRLFNGILLSHQ